MYWRPPVADTESGICSMGTRQSRRRRIRCIGDVQQQNLTTAAWALARAGDDGCDAWGCSTLATFGSRIPPPQRGQSRRRMRRIGDFWQQETKLTKQHGQSIELATTAAMHRRLSAAESHQSSAGSRESRRRRMRCIGNLRQQKQNPTLQLGYSLESATTDAMYGRQQPQRGIRITTAARVFARATWIHWQCVLSSVKQKKKKIGYEQ